MIHKIQANSSGSKFIEVSDEHLNTIQKYSLFRNLVDSNGIIDEDLLDKLRLNIRSLLANEENTSKELLDLCLDVIYHKYMKAFGLHQLMLLYIQET